MCPNRIGSPAGALPAPAHAAAAQPPWALELVPFVAKALDRRAAWLAEVAGLQSGEELVAVLQRNLSAEEKRRLVEAVETELRRGASVPPPAAVYSAELLAAVRAVTGASPVVPQWHAGEVQADAPPTFGGAGRQLVSVPSAAPSAVLGLRIPEPASRTHHGGPRLGSAGFERELDERTHSLARDGNRITPLFDGSESFPARERLIEQAHSSIHYQTFIFNSDDTGWRIAFLLAQKAKQGLAVRLIYDGLGSSRTDPELFALLQAAGVEVRHRATPAETPELANNRWHEKYLVVDGCQAVIGGMNIANEYAYGGSTRLVFSRGEGAEEPWRDTDVLVEGPSVADVQRSFLKNWNDCGTPLADPEKLSALFPPLAALSGGVRARIVQHRPIEDRDHNLENLLSTACRAARTSIDIDIAYFNPTPAEKQALLDAARRGVAVRIHTNSEATNDLSLSTPIGRAQYGELMKQGVQFVEKQGETPDAKPGTLHSKVLIFDGEYSLVGSMNLNKRGAYHDSEVMAAVHDRALAGSLTTRFEEFWAKGHRVIPEELDTGALERVKNWGLMALSGFF